jgi:penicillin amidase
MTRSLALLAVVAVALAATTHSAAQGPPSTTLRIAGVSQQVEILRDRWGIAHIYAQNEADLFFAQGYSAARDRLFQFELWRRQATGTTAEVFGPREVTRDVGARLHMFRGNLAEELNFYHPRGEQIVAAFVRGVNAYIAETERDPSLLPVEFQLLGLKPGRWTSEVVISRHQGLVANVGQEVGYARAIGQLGAARLRELVYFQGGDPLLDPDPQLDLAAIPDNVLELYDAFRSPLRFVPEQIVAQHRNDRLTFDQMAANHREDEREINPSDIGSNNWVLDGSRTQSTFPIMANDPHRPQSAPSLRYWVHLVAPGWNVIGGGEPVLPGVSIGHNDYGAWGLTIFGNDSEDLYVYDTNPANPNEYRYRGQWERMRVISDTIRVKGQPAVAAEYKYTRHGPVLFEDKSRNKAYALRAAWMEVGGAPYLASLRMDQARSWEEFRDACSYNRIPAENMVWADRKGNVGYQAAGIQPLRRNWSGLIPVPGDGRYEWDGYLPITALPNAHNPSRGFIVTANHYLMPNDYPWKEAMHYTWADPYRAARVTELLGSGRLFSIAEVARAQNDDLSIPARSLVPLLADLPLNHAAARARDVLMSWDFVLDKDSVAAGIYEMWQRRLLANIRDLFLPGSVQGAINLSLKRTIDWLMSPGGEFGVNPLAGRDELLTRSLDEAVAELTKKLGPDTNSWKYGQEKYHHALVRHPLADAVNTKMRGMLNVGPAPRGGDAFTVTASGGTDNQTAGGSFKIIADTEDWDNSVGQNNPGQSGNPESPHYRDLFEMWSQGKYFPIAYSRKKVESVAEERILLQP